MKQISDIDALILKKLLEDGRKNFASIAKECNVSEDVIWKHYNSLKKAGIIVGATIQFNYASFNYNVIANFLINVESQHVNEVYNRLSKIPEMQICQQYNSPYNLEAVAILRNINDLQSIKQLLSKNNPINEIKTLIWTQVINAPFANILRSPFEKQNEVIDTKELDLIESNQSNKIVLDKIDGKIVEKLMEKGRISYKKIGQEIRVSADTVARRYKRLVAKRIIQVSIKIDPVKLGFQAFLTFLILLKNHNEAKTIAVEILKIPRVCNIAILSGDYDLRVMALVKDVAEIFILNEEIMKLPHIKKLEADLRSPDSMASCKSVPYGATK